MKQYELFYNHIIITARAFMWEEETCEDCQVRNSIPHFLEHCSRYTEEREQLQKTCREVGVTFNTATILALDAPGLITKALCRYVHKTQITI